MLNDQQLISDEVFEIKCYNFAKKRILTYQNLFVQFKNKYKQSIKIDKKNDEISQCKPLNIMLISYDSVSRSSWLKRLPKTNKFIFETMKFELLKGLYTQYNYYTKSGVKLRKKKYHQYN